MVCPVALILFMCIFFTVKKSRPYEEQAGCIHNMRMIYLACLEYADDHGGFYPSSLDLLYSGERKRERNLPSGRTRQS